MYETYVTVQGRLVADPVVKQGRHGPFTKFRVAQSERHPARDEPGRWVDSDTSYYDVTVGRGMGENAARCLRRGHPVLVHGRLRVRQFQRGDGSPGTAVELDAHALGHDLRWGVTAYTRAGDLEPAVPAAGEHGDPLNDPYTVDDGLGGAPSSEGRLRPGTDSGPLFPPGEGRAA